MPTVVRIIGGENLDQLLQHFAVECIERLRAVQGDERHRAALLDQEGAVVAHAFVSGNGAQASRSGSGAKRTSSISSVTSSGVAGFHRGKLSLSISSARTPSRKSWV